MKNAMIADGTKGSFYIGAVDTGSYLEFLRNAIRLKKELKEISQSQDIGSRKLLGAVRADLHLVRDYNVEALRYAQEHGLPKPDLLPLPYEELFSVNGHRHGHSHDHSIQLGYFQTEDVGEYYKDVMIDIVLPWAQQQVPAGWILQQDNDPKHASMVVKRAFSQQRVRPLEWPRQSPDLNPAEHSEEKFVQLVKEWNDMSLSPSKN
ncbi:hypothetical protein V3C99_018174 [Haemonchus contortus]